MYERITPRDWHDTKFAQLDQRVVLKRLWDVENQLEKTTNHTTELEKYIAQHPYEDDKSLVLGFLKTHPDILADTIGTLCLMSHKSVESLMHKINVKDYYLETLKGWITGTTYKDGEFHPEYRDKMVENIDAAMNIEDSTY